MKIDSHSHSKLSHDGHLSISELAGIASQNGFSYLAVTEHLDRDYLYGGIREKLCRQLRLAKYDREFAKEKTAVSQLPNFYLAYGVEIGYAAKCAQRCAEETGKYDYDVIVNSIHTLSGRDMYFKDFFDGKTRDSVYNAYLDTLYESLSAPYRYNVVGHIGYIARYAPYEETSLFSGSYDDKLQAILKEIIAKDKTVEINTHITHPLWEYLPEKELLARYYAQGGRRITYSSDSHRATDVGKNYALAAELALSLGFSDWTVYVKGEPVTEPITLD